MYQPASGAAPERWVLEQRHAGAVPLLAPLTWRRRLAGAGSQFAGESSLGFAAEIPIPAATEAPSELSAEYQAAKAQPGIPGVHSGHGKKKIPKPGASGKLGKTTFRVGQKGN